MCRHLKSVRVFPLTLRTRSGSQEFGGGQCSAEWNQKIEIYVAPFKLMQSLVLSFILDEYGLVLLNSCLYFPLSACAEVTDT